MKSIACRAAAAVLVFLASARLEAQTTNLALNRPTSASSFQGTAYQPPAAVDNSTSTRWSSAFTNTEWWSVDLGASYQLSKIVIKWEAAYATAYDLQTSDDGVTWTTFFSGTNAFPANAQGTSTVTPPPGVMGRFVKVVGRQRAIVWGSQWGYSFWECQVFGALPPPPPGTAGSPAPANAATGVPVTAALGWSAAPNATQYDVSIGTANPPPIVSAGQAALSFQPAAALAASTTYFWRVDAKGAGGTTPGAVWSFTTAASAPPPPPVAPSVPTGPSPADLSTGALTGIALNWQPSTNATSYDVYFGGTNPPPAAAAGLPATSYQPAALAASTAYFWRVVANGPGGQTSGPVWTFTTAAPPPPPPPPTGDLPSTANTLLKRLRVFDWNVAQGYNPVTHTNDYNLQIDLIASLAPDIVTLQEMSYSDADMLQIFIDGLTQRTGRPWHGYYQRTNAETTPTTDNTGSAILTWLPVDGEAHTLIADDPSHPFEALRIQVTVNATPIHVSTTHLYAWDAVVRGAQIVSLQTWLAAAGARRIATGDYNAFPGESTTWNTTWTTEYTDAWLTATGWVQPTNDGGFTFDKRTATGNPERIDYHWTKGTTVSEMSVVKTRRSDHHAVVVDYSVP